MYRPTPACSSTAPVERKRADDEMRYLDIRLGTVAHANGSAYLELGRTKVIASVFFRERIHENDPGFVIDVTTAPYLEPLDPSLPSKLYIALESMITDEDPLQVIELFVNVIDDDGSILAAAINCGNLALVHASVPMIDFITASTVFKASDTNYQLDYEKEDESKARITVATMPTQQRIAYFDMLGRISPDVMQGMIQIAQNANNKIAEKMKEIFIENEIKIDI